MNHNAIIVRGRRQYWEVIEMGRVGEICFLYEKELVLVVDNRKLGYPVKGEIPKGSNILVCKWRVVWPTYDAEQHRHLKWVYNTRSQKLGNPILKRKERGETFGGAKDKANVNMTWGKAALQSRVIWVRIWRECKPVKGKQKEVHDFLRAMWIGSLGSNILLRKRWKWLSNMWTVF